MLIGADRGRGPQVMKPFEIEIGRRYKCDRYDGQYFATVKDKRDGRIGVVMGNKVGTADLADLLTSQELIWLEPRHIHPL
jgi:hypothetical protein